MGKATPDVQIPGAPAAPAGDADTAGNPAQSAPAADVSAEIAARDAEIAQLRAQLAAQNAPAAPSIVQEADGPNSRRYRAESKHLEYTTTQLDALVRAGKVKLADHHVLCSDGWYVNPSADREARADLR